MSMLVVAESGTPAPTSIVFVVSNQRVNDGWHFRHNTLKGGGMKWGGL